MVEIGPAARPGTEERAASFPAADSDGDGYLTAEELRQAVDGMAGHGPLADDEFQIMLAGRGRARNRGRRAAKSTRGGPVLPDRAARVSPRNETTQKRGERGTRIHSSASPAPAMARASSRAFLHARRRPCTSPRPPSPRPRAPASLHFSVTVSRSLRSMAAGIGPPLGLLEATPPRAQLLASWALASSLPQPLRLCPG